MFNNRVPFFAQAALLDQFIHSDHPEADSDAAAVIIRALLSHDELRRYFFRSRPHPAWLPLLRDHGFFSEPPLPVETDQGLMLPPWDIQDYLAAVAVEAPDFVVKHIETIEAHPVYISRAIRCLLGPSFSETKLELPPDEVRKIVPRLLYWLADYSIACRIAEDVWDVTKLLAEAGEEAALTLFAALMRPFPNPQFKQLETFSVSDEAVSLLRESQYEQDTFQEAMRRLQAVDLFEVTNILEAQLLLSLRIEAETTGSDLHPSTWWRSAIEPSGQNHHYSYKNNLLDFLRDAAEAHVAQNPLMAQDTIQRYLGNTDGGTILRRLGLHLLRLSAVPHPDLLAQELLSEQNFNEATCHHEFLRLLEDGYPKLNATDQGRVATIILAGPPEEEAARLADWAAANGPVARQEYTDRYRDYWTLTRLWMIKDNLSEADTETLRRLTAEHGEPAHPTHLTWSSGAFHVSNVSPLSVEQIAALTPANLLNFLREWQPSPEQNIGPEQISREGLGDAVAAAALSTLSTFAATLGELCAIHPDYAWQIFRQASRRAEEGKFSSREWGILLAACEELLRQPEIATGMTRTSLSSWRDVRQQMTQVLDAAIEVLEDAEYLTRIRELLIRLCDDPDPDLDSDRPKQGWAGHGDPQAVAINHVRPSALSGLIAYARKRAGMQDKGPGSARIEPALLDVLTGKLQDESFAVRSVYGRHLMLLYWLDKPWLEAHLGDIFPEENDELSIWKYTAAWDSYVIFNQSLYPDLFTRLRLYYVRAIENLRHGYTTKTHLQPVRGLASHLIFDYISRARTEPATHRDTLLHALFEAAGGRDRGQIAWMVWRLLKDEQEKNEKNEGAGGIANGTGAEQDAGVSDESLWPAALALWQSRMESAASQNFPADFSEEVGWFAALLEFAPPDETVASLWPLLQMTLPYVSSTGHRHQTWEATEKFLAQQVDRDPTRVIELYTQMYERASESAWRDEETRAILSAAAAAPSSRKQALALIDFIARKGDLRFRDIYEYYAL